MEPLRPMVDGAVMNLDDGSFSTEDKHTLARLLCSTVRMDGRDQYLTNALRIYVKSVTDSLDSGNIDLCFCEYEM